MSVPKGAIWQDVRVACLDAIPAAARTSIAKPVGLGAWQAAGYYCVTGAGKKRFDLQTATVDIGCALLTDAECLLDHAAEHRASLWNGIQTTDWLSPAWVTVTVYYWSFFLTLALGRLTGRALWFVTPDAIRQFRRLAPVGSDAPGAGSFRLTCGATASLTERPLRLDKLDGRIHDEVWRQLFRDSRERLALVPAPHRTGLEARLYSALVRSGDVLGGDWPSALRNVVNYRPGFAYTAARRSRVLRSFSHLRKPHTYDVEAIIDRYESNVVRVQSPADIVESPQICADMLVDLTFLLHGITTELYDDLIDRHRLDRRWYNQREHFCESHGLANADGKWPL